MLASCRPAPPVPQEDAATDAEEAGPLWGAPALNRLAEVALSPVEADPALPRGTEIAGLTTALLELGLADLDGVTPEVVGHPVSPGLLQAPREGAERWTLSGRVSEEGEDLVLVLHLCTASGTCQDLRSDRGTRAEPTPSVAEGLDLVAGALVRPRRADAAADQATVQSIDPYAVLLAGRAAATWYGMLPETGGKRDAVARALLVDPDTAVGNWIAGRRALEAGNAEQAHARFVRAAFARPSSALLLADQATSLDVGGKSASAWASWQVVETARPDDARFTIAAARAALRAGSPDETETRLAALPPELGHTETVVKLRVAAAEASGRADTPEYDALLADWSALVPGDPEPVRRRIQWRVHAGRYDEALPYAEALARAGDDPQAVALLTALHAASGQWDQAAMTATDPVLAQRLRARGAGAEQRVALLSDDPAPIAQAVRAHALLEQSQPAAALDVANAALAEAPLNPELLGARADALATLGQVAELDEVKRALHRVDPAWGQGPNTAPGATTTGVQPHPSTP